jgi:diacylglycerol kinase family enzyme
MAKDTESPPVAADQPPAAPVSQAERWLARLAFVAAFAAVAVLAIFGGLRSITALIIGLAGLAVMCAGAWWFLTNRGLVRWLAAFLAVAAPVGVLVTYIIAGLLWEFAVSAVLVALAVAAGRGAITRGKPLEKPSEYETPPPSRPFIIMNPRSGGGKVGKFGLKDKATALGADVALLEGPGTVDVAALAIEAADGGADLLGVAGGDGTQALIAGVASSRGLPIMVISAGTRNHFALDLGLDRTDPSTCLDALTDGVELRVDLGLIGDRTFVNNASFGAYAAVVQSPEYRDDKVGTTLQMLPDLLVGHRGAHLKVIVDEKTIIDGPAALLVSNNAYETGDISGLGRRARLDTGELGVVGVHVQSAAQAAGLLSGAHSRGLSVLGASEVVIEADAPEIPVGIDGEAVMMPTPVRCTIQPLSLRVRVPRDRPGVPPPKARVDWGRLRRDALTIGRRPGG